MTNEIGARLDTASKELPGCKAIKKMWKSISGN